MSHLNRNLLILFTMAVLLALGCSSDAETDSETHWQTALSACSGSADCQDGLDCICGVCTATCDASSGACGEVDSAAECVVGEHQLPARCSAEAPAGGVCLEPCTSSDQCEQRDPQLACENGRCISSGDGEQPDTGAADASKPLYCEDGPVHCCDDLDLPSGRIAFGVHSGPQFARPEYDFETDTKSGVWHGLNALTEPEPLNCLDNAAELGLPCEVDYVGFFEDDEKVEYEFLIGLPRTLLDSLPTGEPVDVIKRMGGWSVLRQTDGVPLIVAAHSFWGGEFDTLSLPGFEISAATDETQADEAVCLSDFDDCGRSYVYSRLRVVADEENILDPGERVDFSAQGQRFRLWHKSSIQRYGGTKYGRGSQCADREQSHLNFALIWLGED